MKDIVHRPFLEHLARVHHDHPVAGFRDHAKIVGDQDDRHPELLLQPVQQLEDLRLDGHVQRGGRLIRDQELGVAGQRHRDHHPLPHPAGKLVRILADPLLGDGDADQLQHLDRPVARVALVQP